MKKQILLLAALTITSVCSYAQTNYDNFNGGPRIGKITMKSGVSNLKSIKVANPKKDKINSSDSCGAYVRSPTTDYDFVKINTGKLVDVTPYVEGNKKITMLFWSPTAGTNVEIFLQDAVAAEAPFPKGRHSMYRATTSEENKWELLTFEFVFQADETVPATNISQLLIQVAPNSKDGSTYYFDDLTGPNPVK